VVYRHQETTKPMDMAKANIRVGGTTRRITATKRIRAISGSIGTFWRSEKKVAAIEAKVRTMTKPAVLVRGGISKINPKANRPQNIQPNRTSIGLGGPELPPGLNPENRMHRMPGPMPTAKPVKMPRY